MLSITSKQRNGTQTRTTLDHSQQAGYGQEPKDNNISVDRHLEIKSPRVLLREMENDSAALENSPSGC